MKSKSPTGKKTGSLPEKHVRKKHLGAAALDFDKKDDVVISVSSESPVPEARPQRDARGYFLPGNTLTKGTRHRYRKILEQVTDEDFREVLANVIEQSKQGNLKAADLLWRYTMPAGPEPEALRTKLKTKTAVELADSMDVVIESMNDGDISPDGANNYLKCLSAKRDFISVAFLETRLNGMDDRIKNVERK